jgi:hypothetical protein
MDELSQNHEVLVSRTEDLEDDMQVMKMDIVIALAVSLHSFPFPWLQHVQLNNSPYLSLLKPSHEITQQENEHKHDNHDYDCELDTLMSTTYSHPNPLRAALSSDQPTPCRQDIVKSSKVSSLRLSQS